MPTPECLGLTIEFVEWSVKGFVVSHFVTIGVDSCSQQIRHVCRDPILQFPRLGVEHFEFFVENF